MTREMLKCPKCGYVFKAPFWDRKKNIAYGWTLPNWGVIVCPKCKYVAPRKDFLREKEKK